MDFEASFVTELLQKYKIINYRDLFEKKQYSKAFLPKDLDYLIKPFLLSENQRHCHADLYNISQYNTQLRIQSFADGDVSTFQLHLSKDRQIEAEVRKILPTTIEKKRKMANNAEDDGKKKQKGERRKKTLKDESARLIHPHVLQPVLQEVFDEFWNMDLEPDVAIPFFTTITRDNCAHLGMPDFYDKISTECTFADMKEKLNQSQYTQPEQFENDFNLMVNNTLTYFPPGTPQFQKAKELKHMFDLKWKDAFGKISTLFHY